MKDTIFITGGTGFLGTELSSQLAGTIDPETRVFILVRAGSEAEAYHRLRQAWQHDPLLYGRIGTQFFPVTGDLTSKRLGISAEDARMLREEVTLVFHCGANIGFQEDEKTLASVNAGGTAHALSFAGHLKHLRRFVHVSTAYVAGQKSGRVMEDESTGSAFSGYYEKSKAKAEELVKQSGLPWSICRPGMIIGHSKSGYVKSFNTIYYVLKLYLLGSLRVLPTDAKAGLNLVPVDYVAGSVMKIGLSEGTQGKIFHLTCPQEKQPRVGELTAYVRLWAAGHLGADLPKPVFAPVSALKKAGMAYNRVRSDRKKNLLSNLLTLMPYFFSDQIFDRTNTDKAGCPFTLNWKKYIDPILEFACRKNFMRQTGQTVFEQALVRRESMRYPIRYYDITSGGIQKVSGPEANRRIRQIRDALLAWGIRKGDRVALTGINSVDYMTLEQAIGLVGAVSVPIYYTTPAAETDLLLQRSGAKWFFIGDARMMKQAQALTADVTIVAFSAGLPEAKEGAMPWIRFLNRKDGNASAQYPDPDDLATIRYTSGTTGEPKGVMFSFRQLSWMGEVLTNLLPWEDRNRSMRYLSFLPLSHVVEGILASYAPYYVLASVDYYYLNDFQALTDALPKVRPNVFFSVPRFYEKVWNQLCANPLGRRWLALKDTEAGKGLALPLRMATLRKAGLDRCRQLIAGSAPVSETLLLNFRKLGIEIYNAYGQTEAPLITINRLGDNVIPTVGTPLPETEVTAEADGELIVRGPQVALGYYGLETDTIRPSADGRGVLRTGDLGIIHENGHITLQGRKKEMIVTAYGKNISIPKIEEKLKSIPGVSEAVLIGENRPYCTALLWLEDDGAVSDAEYDAKLNAELDRQIRQMNGQLSHPEQIRAYRIISKPLSIQAGELTPNLKVKRANVEEHLKETIEEMYR